MSVCYKGCMLQVYEAVMSWVHHNLPARQACVEQLLENVRLPLMNQEYIVQKVEEEPLVKANSRYLFLLLHWLFFSCWFYFWFVELILLI